METLSFPGLGLSFELNRVAFNFFGFPIYWYGILFGLSFLVGVLYALKKVSAFGLDADRMVDILIGAIIGSFIGARLYYVIFTWDVYKNNLLRIFNVREGGIALYGGMIGGALAILLMCRLRRVKLMPQLDLFANSMLIAQAIGRWGNFINMEAFGVTTKSVWGMSSPSIQRFLEDNHARLSAIRIMVTPGDPVHPTFLYESAWCFLGFVLLSLYLKHRRFDGEITLLYLGWYGLGRAFIEGLRTDSLMLGTIRISQLVAILCVIASLISLIIVRIKIRRANDPEFLKLYIHTDEGKAILAGAFYKKAGSESPAADEKTQTGEAENPEAEAAKTEKSREPDETEEPEEDR